MRYRFLEFKVNICSLFVFARIGAISIGNPSINGITDYEAEEFIVHENYSRIMASDGTEVIRCINDIGLLKLVQEVSFDSILRPACLQQEEFMGEKVIAVSEMGNWNFC